MQVVSCGVMFPRFSIRVVALAVMGLSFAVLGDDSASAVDAPSGHYAVRVINDTDRVVVGFDSIFGNVESLPIRIPPHQDGAVAIHPGQTNIDFRYQIAGGRTGFDLPVTYGVNFAVRMDRNEIVIPECHPDLISHLACSINIENGGPSITFKTIVFRIMDRPHTGAGVTG